MEEVKRGFKIKTIEEIIKNKVKAWLNSIHILKEDGSLDKETAETLKKEITENYFVTGGAIASMLQGEMPNDFDIYFKDATVAKKVTDYYLNQVKHPENSRISKIESVVETETDINRVKIIVQSAGIIDENVDLEQYKYFEQESPSEISDFFKVQDKYDTEENHKGKFKLLFASTNAITLSDDVQLVLRFIGEPETVHKYYDFVHCTNYFSESTGLVVNQQALISILSKELKYVGSKYPICSMFRIKKFIQRGWTITAGEMLKIAWDINNLDLDDLQVLEEQLVGVDAAYFLELLNVLKKQGYSKDKPLDRTYLFEIINRVFDESEL